MLIRIAIVDDQPEARELLRQDLLVRAPAGTSIACFDSSESFLSGFVPGDDSLIFLDICMKGMNGIEAAERVRKRSARCLIVFLTSSREYAFDAFHWLRPATAAGFAAAAPRSLPGGGSAAAPGRRCLPAVSWRRSRPAA